MPQSNEIAGPAPHGHAVLLTLRLLAVFVLAGVATSVAGLATAESDRFRLSFEFAGAMTLIAACLTLYLVSARRRELLVVRLFAVRAIAELNQEKPVTSTRRGSLLRWAHGMKPVLVRAEAAYEAMLVGRIEQLLNATAGSGGDES